MDLNKMAEGFRTLMEASDLDLNDPNFCGTPMRVARMFENFFEGTKPEAEEEIEKYLSVTFPAEYKELITFLNISCWSMCPHHFLPVKYNVSVGYIPNESVLGASKIPRLVILLGKRPVLQEQFTKDITSYINRFAKPAGVIAVVEGRHMCMQSRGVKTTATMNTASLSGCFETQHETRKEFYDLIARGSTL